MADRSLVLPTRAYQLLDHFILYILFFLFRNDARRQLLDLLDTVRFFSKAAITPPEAPSLALVVLICPCSL